MDKVTPAEARYIVNAVRNHSGVDLSGFTMSNLRLVLGQFIRTKGIQYTDILISRLLDYPDQLEELVSFLEQPDLEMFRDPEFWQLMKETLLPRMISRFDPLKIWLPYNSTGEELYSLLILFHELASPVRMEIVSGNVSTIRQQSIMGGVLGNRKYQISRMNYETAGGKNNFADYFMEADSQYRLKLPQLQDVSFRIHPMIPDNSDEQFHIILIRNRLLMFNQEIKEKILQQLASVLDRRGLLILGYRENLSNCNSPLFPSDEYMNEQIYKLKE